VPGHTEPERRKKSGKAAPKRLSRNIRKERRKIAIPKPKPPIRSLAQRRRRKGATFE